jgi:hypothetical protein
MNYDAFAQILRGMRCPACGRKLHNCGLGVMGCEACQRFWSDENIYDCFRGCYRIWTEQYGWKLGWAARSEPPQVTDLDTVWEPGSSAFWLDPELWSRTPEVNGRPDICWMYLPVECGLPITHRARLCSCFDETVRPYNNAINFGGFSR